MNEARLTTSVSRMSSRSRALTAHYEALERHVTVRRNFDYEQLVVPNGNGMEAIHRWFHLKEAFSRRLVARVVKDLRLDQDDRLRILDPFAGSGTTAIAVAELIQERTLKRAYALSYECNPFLHLVASTKLRALQTPTTSFLSLAQRVAATAARDRIAPVPIPSLATFHNDDYFDRADLDRLLQLRAAIEEARQRGASELDADLALLCLGGSVEPVSALRRDGRALRYVPDKRATRPISEFLRRAEQVQLDIPRRSTAITGRVQLGDGRTLRPRPPTNGTVDLVLFSPPYPNNIDYTEVYKLEAWLLGFITNSAEFTRQRMKSVYSHPSILRFETEPSLTASLRQTVDELVEPLLDAVPEGRYHTARRSMLSGYATDMLTTLQSSYRALRPGGHLVYVVGNSVHGSGNDRFLIAADLLIARLATAVGFEIESLEVARELRRRGFESRFLRESVVFARRPTGRRRPAVS